MEYTTKPSSIKMWAEDDRPREKMKLKGYKSLSDSELIAILIGSGTRELSAIEVAKELLRQSDNNLQKFAQKSIIDFQQVKGIGEAKAITIAAALELGRRRRETRIPERPKILSSRDAYQYITPYFQDELVESFYIILLNRSCEVLETILISIGGMTGTLVDGKVVFKKAFSFNAHSMVLAHNHPSGNRRPSELDIRITKKLVEFGKMIDLSVVDHIIYTNDGYYSFSDDGVI